MRQVEKDAAAAKKAKEKDRAQVQKTRKKTRQTESKLSARENAQQKKYVLVSLLLTLLWFAMCVVIVVVRGCAWYCG